LLELTSRLEGQNQNSVEQVGVTVEFYGGELNGVSYSDPATVQSQNHRRISTAVLSPATTVGFCFPSRWRWIRRTRERLNLRSKW
jgi:hypothetical protein